MLNLFQHLKNKIPKYLPAQAGIRDDKYDKSFCVCYRTMLNRKNLPLLVIFLFAALLRFYNLMWGDGFFFHPDEGNMARSISRMIWAKRLYPDFFAYGQLPLYIAYFFSLVFETIGKIFLTRSFEHLPLITAFTSPQTPAVIFPQAVFWLRFISASASVATVWV